ncbi:hypothetical protein PENTCL1PPCAC_5127, partial [Pristionchus entomophagus]
VIFSEMAVPSEKLPSGHDMPWVGLGTWMAAPGVVGESVEKALNAGYRHIDCAHAYLNQPEIGAVFKKIFDEGNIARSDVFITSKIWNTFHSYEKAKEVISTILRELSLDYLDLMLIHWPMGYEEGGEFFPKEGEKMRFSNEDYLGTWKAMEEAVAEGRIRSLGVSNFNHAQMERLQEHATIKLSMIQVELHPYFQQAKLRAWCKEKGVAITAYSSLGNPSMPFRKQGDPNILLDETVIEIGKRLGKTPAQVALRWAVQHGIHVIPKSTNEIRIQENLNLFSFSLTEADMATIDALDKNWRILDLSFRDSHHPHFPYKTKEDW